MSLAVEDDVRERLTVAETTMAHMRDEADEMNTDIRDLRVELNDFRKEVEAEFKEVRAEFKEFRREVAEQFADVRREIGADRQLSRFRVAAEGIVDAQCRAYIRVHSIYIARRVSLASLRLACTSRDPAFSPTSVCTVRSRGRGGRGARR